MPTLREALDRLTPSVLTAVDVGDAAGQVTVSDIVVFDGRSVGEVAAGDVVLAVTAADEADVSAALDALRTRRPAAVLVAAGLPAIPATGDRPPVVPVQPGATWTQVLRLVTEASLTSARGPREDDSAPDDLFAVANAIAAVVGAPVTIEDPSSRVLAFSERQEGADAARMATILGRRGPDELVGRMRERGVFARLHSATDPLFVPGRADDVLPRAVAPVRAGGEFLGSIWAVVREPLPPDRQAAFADAARMAALHLLHHRRTVDARRSVEADTVGRLLRGGPDAIDAARAADLAGRGFVVLAAGVRVADAVDEQAALLRLWDFLRLHLTGGHRRGVVAKIGSAIYAVVAGDVSHADLANAIRALAAEATTTVRREVLVGIGSAVATAAALPTSRFEADRVLRVGHASLAERSWVGTLDENGAAVLDGIVLSAVAEHPDIGSGPARRLAEHDRTHGTHLAATVEAWLDTFGDTALVAKRLGVHGNTIRYRMRQVAELGLLDVSDAVERQAVWLHLRLRRWRPGG